MPDSTMRNAGADPSNPQSWNGYSYGMNNPPNLIDPTGMQMCTEDCPSLPEFPDAWGNGDPFVTVILSCAQGDESCSSTTVVKTPAPPSDPSQVKPPKPQQKQAACQAQYQQSVSAARSTATKQFLGFFTAAGIPGDIGLIGCLGTGELAPVCMEGVELALSAPSIVGMFAFVNQYTATV
ncbi:MAG: hypothetical protein ACREBW_07740, partial [Candidatus Micrarchaeaceae archaeon]